MSKSVLIVGSGLGGLATAMRLSSRGYRVEIVEKFDTPGGRLNRLEKDGFTFDTGPSFFSMSYEFEELFRDCNISNPLDLEELDPIYTVNFAKTGKTFPIFKDPEKLAREFEGLEPNFRKKLDDYLAMAGEIFHDTENRIIKKNFPTRLHYLLALTRVPWKHAPKMTRTMWSELERRFENEEIRIILSLVSFFLGATPFDTPAVYSLLNYTELQHDGYWHVKGGMYGIVTQILQILKKANVNIHLNTEIVGPVINNGKIEGLRDASGKIWKADKYVINADAASFRGQILGKKNYTAKKLDKMKWTLAPFTIYLGVKGKVPGLDHHNYFLGENFREYASEIFKTSVAPKKPYYYVNVSSKSNPSCAPEGCENIFILCPVPDKRFKNNWDDASQLADNILTDLTNRTGFDFINNALTKTIWTPDDWEKKFNLYRGSGLGLAHDMNQIGGFRPSNKDESFPNIYYTGASTVPGTGLPIVVISSKLTTERILNDDRVI